MEHEYGNGMDSEMPDGEESLGDPNEGQADEPLWQEKWEKVSRSLSPERRAAYDTGVTYVDILLVASIKKEWEALAQTFDVLPARYTSGRRAPWRLRAGWLAVPGTELRYRLGIMLGYGAGSLRTLPAIQDAVSRLRPTLVIMSGIAAGNPKANLSLGDVVVSDQIISLDTSRAGDTRWPHTPTRVNREVVDRLAAFLELRRTRDQDHQTVIGTVVAQPSLIRDASVRDDIITKFPETVAIEMEGGALSMACDSIDTAGSIPVLAKAIVDWGDGEKDDAYHTIGALRSARLIRDFLEDGPIEAREAPIHESHKLSDEPQEEDITTAGTLAIVDEGYLVRLSDAFYRDDGFDEVLGVLQDRRAILIDSEDSRDAFGAALATAANVARSVLVIDDADSASYALSQDPKLDTAYVVTWADQRPGGSVSRLASRAISSEAYLIAVGSGSREFVNQGLTNITWPFYASSDRISALRHRLRAEYGDETADAAERLLVEPPVADPISRITSIDALVTACAILHTATIAEWSATDVAQALGVEGSLSLGKKIGDLVSLTDQAWFLAVGILQGRPRTWISRCADSLTKIVSESQQSEVESSEGPFANVTQRLSRIGASGDTTSDGVQTWVMRGVSPGQLFRFAWYEFVSLRRSLLDWAEEVLSDSVTVSRPEDRAWLATELLQTALPEGLGILESLLGTTERPSDVTDRVAVADAALSRIPLVTENRRMVFRSLAGWLRADTRDVRFGTLLILSGRFGRDQPVLSVELISRTLRRAQDKSTKRASTQALSDLLGSSSAAREVHGRFSRWLNSNWIRKAGRENRRAADVARHVATVLLMATESKEQLNQLNEAGFVDIAADLLDSMSRIPAARDEIYSLVDAWNAKARTPEQTSLVSTVYRALMRNATDYRGRTIAQRALRRLGT